MAWVTPKTDWASRGMIPGTLHSQGDYFNAVDYNRIKNNIQYLADLANTKGYSVTIASMGSDKTVGDYFYADEINTMVSNLKTIDNATFHIGDLFAIPTYNPSGIIFTYGELNVIENMCLKLYTRLNA